MDLDAPRQATGPSISKTDHNPKLWKLAQDVEASFLAEMLKSTGLAKTREGFGGGFGEDHFSTFLVREYAHATVASGGVGLTESIYRSLVAYEEAAK